MLAGSLSWTPKSPVAWQGLCFLHKSYHSWQRFPVCQVTWVAMVVGGRGELVVAHTGRDCEMLPQEKQILKKLGTK